MALKSPVPCRLTVFVARQAAVGLILRRGPTRWFQLILWDTKKDRFQRGQWFHGRVYGERCDLSPDGTKFIYFASSYGDKRDADMPDTWTAISKPPYFTALALWPNGSTWGGGGMFLDNRRFWHGERLPLHRRFSLKGLVDVPENAYAATLDWRSLDYRLGLRLLHSGWEILTQVEGHPLEWKKPNPVGNGELLLDRSFSSPTYFLLFANKRDERQAFDAEWADWDQKGRLIVTHKGKLLVGKYNRHTPLRFEELADFNNDRPEGIEAPEWARRW
jgi:hypothetical protein